ncbi:hypothetical protein BaRGS_00022504 [Batillaria attramentaria]|uniref:Uncharacterized protein n=1 Tax=Batillaria attramentaria TaxID=370345 RepID=A0ABD0KGL5_9CAEN
MKENRRCMLLVSSERSHGTERAQEVNDGENAFYCVRLLHGGGVIRPVAFSGRLTSSKTRRQAIGSLPDFNSHCSRVSGVSAGTVSSGLTSVQSFQCSHLSAQESTAFENGSSFSFLNEAPNFLLSERFLRGEMGVSGKQCGHISPHTLWGPVLRGSDSQLHGLRFTRFLPVLGSHPTCPHPVISLTSPPPPPDCPPRMIAKGVVARLGHFAFPTPLPEHSPAADRLLF